MSAADHKTDAIQRLVKLYRECTSTPPTDDELLILFTAAVELGAGLERLEGTKRTIREVMAAYAEGRMAGRGGIAAVTS